MNPTAPYYYSEKSFQGRVEQISGVKKLVNRFQNGDTSERAQVFAGPRGAGKSWLCLHLARFVFKETHGVTPFLISLLPIPDGEEPLKNEWWPKDAHEFFENRNDPYHLVGKIITKLAGVLKVPALEKTGLEMRSRNLALEIGRFPQEKVILLIVDSAYESPEDLLRELQTYLITPLLHTERVIVIATGRGKPPRWQSPFLRDAENKFLASFDIIKEEKEINQLIQSGGGKYITDPERIKQFSGCYPLHLRLLATSKAPNFERAVNEMIDQLVSGAIASVTGAQPEERSAKNVRAWLEKLSVVQHAFREEEVIGVLSDDEQNPIPRREVQNIVNILLTYQLAEWDREGSGYRINISMIHPIREYLREFAAEKWLLYCQRAIRQYNNLAEAMKDDQQTRAYYQDLTNGIRKLLK